MGRSSGRPQSTWWQRLQTAAGYSMQEMAVPPMALLSLYASGALSTREAGAQAPTVPLPPVQKAKPPQQAPPVEGAPHQPSPLGEGPPYLLMIVPFDEGEIQAQAMENWFQACATDEPFSLELTGTRREQGFLLRASSKAQLTLLRKQFEAQYPQADIDDLTAKAQADPLLMQPGEQVLIGDFALSRDSWMPLKTFSGEALTSSGGDPLAHILASMESLVSGPAGSGQCITAQLVLQRAPDSWIAPDIRKAVEHPLQEERDAQAAAFKGGKGAGTASDPVEGLKIALLVAAGIVGYGGYRWYQEQAYLPFWLMALALLAGGIGLLWWRMRMQRRPIYDMKLVSEKLMRQAFYCQLRVIVKSRVPPLPQDEQKRRAAMTPRERARVEQADRKSVEEQLRSHLSHVEVAYRQFSLASANSLYLKRTRLVRAGDERAVALPSLSRAFPYHHWLLRLLSGGPTKCVLNGLELAGMYHLPQAITDLPLVKRTSVKRLLFSPEIARKIAQMTEPFNPVLIGHSKHRGHEVEVRLPFPTLFEHKFLIGRSRSGKSVLIQLLARGALQPVRDSSPQPGFFGIDPHRDLAFDLLRFIPESRWRDVLFFDFTDTAHPVALNPLDATMGFTRNQAVSNLMSAFERIWHETWGPRMAYFLNSVCLVLYTLNEGLVRAGRANEQYTLLDVNPLLQYKDYAIKVLSQLDKKETWHQELLAWWQETYFQLPSNSSFRNEVITPILSKIGVFNNNQILRRIVGQPITKAPVHKAITEGKMILCALSARDMDDMAVNILGSTLLNLLHAAFRLQQETPLQQRRRVFVAVDEFQNFSGSAFDKLLSEDAKFGCSMLMATQNLTRLTQVKQGLLEVVLSNCQHFFAFNISADDAGLLEKEYQKKVLMKDFISQPKLHCYVRMAIEHEPMQIASVFLKKPASWETSPAQQSLVDDIRWRNHLGMPSASDVDKQHGEHLKRFLDVDAFANWIVKNATALERKRQSREAEDAIKTQGDTSESTPLPPSHLASQTSVRTAPDSTSTGRKDQSRPHQQVESHEQGSNGRGHAGPGAHATGSTQPTAANGSQQGGSGRNGNNHRSRRLNKLKKNQVGTPLPDPPDEARLESDDAQRPLSFPSGRSHGGGYEGRERGERV